ncbi:DUF4190 domain-containing protein [Nocardioides sp. AE5]|uniref:DUF4190 domain-containing protein n=1 Tax=Nocardioides sp. AE5 TaxID=2962573 RepID=UPI002880EC22|nr:DUF4190 domain-containing protein [Nocardioides sp. AE5]MDT0200740.1 DUF4190 domain-containing protein [Nocardioides sp. AE5]
MSTPNDPDEQGAFEPPAAAWPPPPPPGWGVPHQPGYAPYQYVPPPPPHPAASTSLTLGLISLIGGMLCYVPILMAPYALIHGRRTVREIDAEPGRWSGRESASAGYILGIIGTVILALGILVTVGVVTLLVVMDA